MKHGKLPLRGRIYRLRDRPGYSIKYYEGSMRTEKRIPEDLPEHQVFVYAREFLTARELELRAAPEAEEPSEVVTFESFARRWTSGELHRVHQDHVLPKRTARDDELRLVRHVFPVIGSVPITEFTGTRGIELAEDVMRRLPETISRPTRRHVAQVVRRVLRLAAYPCKLIPVCPLPETFVPPARAKRGAVFLYPDEEAGLIACTSVPIEYRVLFGFLAREGMRVSEAVQLDWSDVDLHRGIVRLDVNKTDDPRSWALRTDVVMALRRWALFSGSRVGFAFHPVDSLTPIRANPLAKLLRRYLVASGCDRNELFVPSENRIRLRAHDLRATFVTLALANGKTETWVMDRTGHQSSQMLQRYRRSVNLARERELGDLVPMHEAIPELASVTMTSEEAVVQAATEHVV